MNRILRISAAMAILALVNSHAFTAVDPAIKEAWDRLPKAERLFQQGVKEFRAGRSQDAVKSFERCLGELPRHAFARYYLANIAYIANDMPRALGDMNKAVEDLGFMESLNDYGLTQKAKTYDSYKRMMNEEWASAANCRARREIESLTGEITDTEKKQELQRERQKAARVRQRAHYLYFRGNIHFRLERFDAAARDYEQAIVLDPQQANAYNNLAAIYYLAGDHAAALDYLERATRQGLEDNLNLTLQSLVFQALGRPTEGILREEISAGPSNDLGIVRFALTFLSKDPLRPPLYENGYVVYSRSTRRAVLIDPGVEDPRIEEFVRARDLQVGAVLYTHGHEDHVGAGPHYASLYRAPVLVKAEDAKGLAPAPDRTLTDGETLTYDGFALKVLHVPGHTPGSVCFLAGDVLFSGDTLFKDGIGLVVAKDGGSAKTLQAEMVRRIQDKLLVLPDATRVFSGHGKTTTIGDERANNAFLKQ